MKKLMTNLKVSTKLTFFVFFILFFIFRITLTFVPNSTTLNQGTWSKQWKAKPSNNESERIRCDLTHDDYDLCIMSGPVLLNPMSFTLYALNPDSDFDSNSHSDSESPMIKTRPYPRKTDNAAISNVKNLTLTSSSSSPSSCGVTHSTPALVFSAGGYTGNFFHDFNEGFLPLFLTLNSLFPYRDDVVLVITDCRDYWLKKYALLLRQFSQLPIINFDKETTTHCFPLVSVGLIKHGTMVVDPKKLPGQQTITDFVTLLEKTYSNNSNNEVIRSSDKPRLVLVARKGNVGRVILNQDEVIATAEEVGFDVIHYEPSSNTLLAKAFSVIHGSHAVLGVHGAALTHLLFMRPGSVFVQVVPIGTKWISEDCYGKPARELGIEYVEYVIRDEESSLIEMYGSESLVMKDPSKYHNGNWTNMRVYLKDQNVKLNVNRLKKYLKRAYEKAKQIMDKEK